MVDQPVNPLISIAVNYTLLEFAPDDDDDLKKAMKAVITL